MRKTIIIGIVIGLLFFGGSAVLTALAIKQATNSTLWDIVLWGGTAMVISAVATLALYISSQPSGRPFLWPALCINLGLCLIIAGFVWHFSEETSAKRAEGHSSQQPKATDNLLQLACSPQVSFTLPLDGNFYSLQANYKNDRDIFAGFQEQWLSDYAARAPHVLPGANSDLWLCKITNYSDAPVFNLRAFAKIDFMNTTKANSGLATQGVRYSKDAEISIPKIEANGVIEFYAYSASELIVLVHLPETAEIQRLGSPTRETVQFIRPLQFFFLPPSSG